MRVLVSTENLSHEQWLKYRRRGLGGSDASVVFGVNRYKSPIELWMDKTGQTPYQEAGEAAYWGTQLESVVRAEFSKRTGIEVKLVNKILQSSEYSYMLANLDGVCMCPTHGKCIFEAKTASAYKVDEWREDSVPPEYALQLQHYLTVTGYAGAYIAVLIGGNTFQYNFIERDEDLISILIRKERDFWELVQDGVPPCLDGTEASAQFLNNRFPRSIPQSKINLPDTAAALIHQYNAASEKLDQITEQKREAENLLKQMLGTNELGVVGSHSIRWSNITQERFDTKLFKDEMPEIYAKYVGKSSYRRFSIKTLANKSVQELTAAA